MLFLFYYNFYAPVSLTVGAEIMENSTLFFPLLIVCDLSFMNPIYLYNLLIPLTCDINSVSSKTKHSNFFIMKFLMLN